MGAASCAALELPPVTFCTLFVRPESVAARNACRLIAINKCLGVHPIGICEVVHRILGKAVLSILKSDIQSVTGSLQLCTGQIAGIEAVIHAMGDLQWSLY